MPKYIQCNLNDIVEKILSELKLEDINLDEKDNIPSNEKIKSAVEKAVNESKMKSETMKDNIQEQKQNQCYKNDN